MPLRDIAIIVSIVATIPFILKDPYFGVLAWNWLAFMNPHRYAWGFAEHLRLSLVVGASSLLSFLVHGKRRPFPWNASLVLMVLLLGWVWITTWNALNPQGAFLEADRFTKVIVMVLVAAAVVDSRERLDGLIWTVAVSLGVFGVKGGLFTIATGGAYRVYGPPGSFIEGNNEIAFALIMLLPLLRYLQLCQKNRNVRWVLGGAMILCGFSIVGSYSRGAFLAGSAMVFLLWLRSRRRMTLFLASLPLLILLFTFMPQKWYQRMESIQNYQQDASAMGRINAWLFALNLAMDRPIFGGGARTFTPELFYRYAPNPEDFHDVHSIYFEMLGEQGFVGLFLFLGIGISAFLTAQSLIKRCGDKEDWIWARDLGAMCQTSIVGYAVGGAFLGLSYWDLPYLIVAIVAITNAIVKRGLGEEGEATSVVEEQRP